MESFKDLKPFFIEWLKDKPKDKVIRLRLKPGVICNNVIYSIENSIYQIEQIPPEEWIDHPISVTAKEKLQDIYKAIQDPKNFDLTDYFYEKQNWFK